MGPKETIFICILYKASRLQKWKFYPVTTIVAHGAPTRLSHLREMKGNFDRADNWKPIIRQSVIFKCRMRDTAEISASRRSWSRNQGECRARSLLHYTGQWPSPVARISLSVVTSESYQVSLSNIDYQIVNAVVNLKTLILRHMQTTSLSSLGCCETHNRIVS